MKQATMIVFALLLFTYGGLAQGGVPSDSMARVSITSSGDTIIIYDKTTLLGTTPLMNKPVSPGIHLFRFFPVTRNEWMDAANTEIVSVAAGESLHLQIELPFRYTITSEPYGATILNENSVLGKTPASLWLPAEIKSLRLTLPGYLESNVFVTRKESSIHAVLRPEKGFESSLQSPVILNSTKQDNLPVYVTASLSVVSGVIAAFFKIKADNYYDEYRNTGFEGNLNKMHSYDRISGVSLAVGELNLGVLTYLLLRR